MNGNFSKSLDAARRAWRIVIQLSCWFCLIWLIAPSAFGATAPEASFGAASGAGLPDTGASLLRVFGALVLVTAIFLGGVWLFRNFRGFGMRNGNSPRLNVYEVRSLGQRQSLFVVGYEQQRMLLASSPGGITLVTHLPMAEESARVPQTATRMSFAEAFQQVLNRK